MTADGDTAGPAARSLVLLVLLFSCTEGWGPKPNETYTEVVPSLVPARTPRPPIAADGDDSYVFPDTDGNCPRDEDAAKFQGRVCMKKCETDANCLSANRKCVCDGVCGMSCVKQDKECPKLKPPDFGRMKLNERTYGATAKYACREGFRLVGPGTRLCQADGRWSGLDPVCKELNKDVFCEGSPNITNARHNASYDQLTFDLNTTLYYSCHEGYQNRGIFAEAKCLMYNETAKWFGPDMYCEPKRCSSARQIENGIMENNCSNFLCRASYQCNQGFELVGRANTYCQSDGSWQPSELPTCTPPSEIDCGKPGPLHNGWIGGNSTSMNAQITFHCNKDTVRVGQFESATCSSNGRWSQPLPKCMGPCELPRVTQGQVVNHTSQLVLHGESITVQCRDRYEMQLSHEMPQCYNGTWSHIPICGPARCKQLPPDPEHGFVIAPKNDHGSRAKFMCRDGFVLRGDNVTTCTYGEWTGRPPRCDIVYCTFPGDIANGSVLLVGNMGLYDYRAYVRKVRNNRMISYKCQRGFTLSAGPPGATCVDGVWRPPRLPTCSPDKHPTLTSWFNKRSVRSVRSELVRRIRRWAVGTDVPRRPGQSRRRAAQRRRRRRRRQPCDPIATQTYLRVDVVRPGKDANYTYSRGSRVKVTCGHGYQLNIGNKVARCVRGHWRPEKPSCVAMACTLPSVRNGVWLQRGQPMTPPADQISHESVVNLTCADGFNVQGASAVTCWYGTLTNQVADCVPAPCQLPALENGAYTEPGYKPGLYVAHNFSVTYECEPGHSAASEQPPRCEYGRLRPSEPNCQLGLLNTVSTGNVTRWVCSTPSEHW